MADAHAHADEHGHDHDYMPHIHVAPLKTYLAVFGALIALTGLTVAAYNVRLGDANLFVAVLIATMKATIVGAWFMHLIHEQRFNILFFVGSLLFVSVFFAYTFNDTNHRGRGAEVMSGRHVDPTTGQPANGLPALLSEHGEFQPLAEHEDGEGAHEGADGAEGEEGAAHEGDTEDAEVEAALEEAAEDPEEAADAEVDAALEEAADDPEETEAEPAEETEAEPAEQPETGDEGAE